MCWKLLKYVLWTSKQWLVEPSYSKHSNSPAPEQHDSNKHLMNISQQLSTPRVDALTWVSISIIHKSISSHKIGINEWIFGPSRPGSLKCCELLGINLILARRPTVLHLVRWNCCTPKHPLQAPVGRTRSADRAPHWPPAPPAVCSGRLRHAVPARPGQCFRCPNPNPTWAASPESPFKMTDMIWYDHGFSVDTCSPSISAVSDDMSTCLFHQSHSEEFKSMMSMHCRGVAPRWIKVYNYD